jgi:hypothetical protein
VINRAAARRYWKTRDPVGTQIQVAGSAVHIVGVVEDFQQDQLAQPAFPAVLVSILQDYRPDFVFHLASTGQPGALADPLRRTVAAIDRALALYDVRTMAEHMQVPTFPYRLGSIVTGVFGAIALLLAALGLYAVVHQSLAERRADYWIARSARSHAPRHRGAGDAFGRAIADNGRHRWNCARRSHCALSRSAVARHRSSGARRLSRRRGADSGRYEPGCGEPGVAGRD